MKRILPILMVPVLLVILATGSAMAIDWTKNITIYDGRGTGTGWYGANEDQEVEPGMVADEVWDLEGFFFDEDATLSMVGEYNYLNYPTYAPGDIFIDLLGDNSPSGSDYNQDSDGVVHMTTLEYNYVLDLDFENGTYDVIALNGNSLALSAYFGQNELSSPWRYLEGGDIISVGNNILQETFTNDESGFAGNDTHYAVSFDLGFLESGTLFETHFTMECGNDNLMGRGNTAPVPEPATMLLLGTGLIGLAGLGRKKFFK